MSAILHSCPKNSGQNIITTTGVTAPNHHSNGLPYEADGSLAIELGTPTHFHQGLGFTVNGRLAVTGSAVQYFGSGCAGFIAGGEMVRSGGGGAVAYAHGNKYVSGSRVATAT